MTTTGGTSSSRASFEFSVREAGGQEIHLQLRGDLDLAAAQPLRALLALHCDAGYSRIHLDLSRVTFLDCSCIGALVSARRRCLATRCALLVHGATTSTRHLLRTLRLEHLLLDESEAFVGAGTSRSRPVTATDVPWMS